MNRTHISIDATDQSGFAISTKTLLLVAVVTGASLLAAGRMSAHVPDTTQIMPEPVMRTPVGFTDPDAELRPWLREAQPPTF
jgi:hypothetical protein